MLCGPCLKKGVALLEFPSRYIHRYEITHIEKYQGMDYTDMAKRIAALMGHTELRNNADLIVDGTGIGDVVVELIRK